MRLRRHVHALIAAALVTLLALGLGVVPASAAVPGNDAFGSAHPITALPAVITGNDQEATKQGQDPASECTNSEKTTWYRLTLGNAAYVLVDAHGSEHSTGISIWTGSSIGGLSEVACSYGSEDDPGDQFFGRVTFRASPGVRYYIRLNAGYEGSATPGGVTKLSVKKVTPPANDNAQDAKPFSSLPFETTVSNVRATTQSGETRTGPCFHSAATVWYRVRPSSTMTLRADTLSSTFDTVLGVLQGGPSLSTMTYVACDDDTAAGGKSVHQSSVTWRALADHTYWIQAGGYDNETGSIDLRVRLVSPPANDNRASAQAIPNVNVTPFSADPSTRNATAQDGETINANCGASDEVLYPQSVWYRYTAPNANKVRIVVTGGGYYIPALSLYSGNSFPTQHAVVCGKYGSLVFTPQAGKTYYLQLAGRQGSSGTYHLTVEPAP